jgi:hypothetical protein
MRINFATENNGKAKRSLRTIPLSRTVKFQVTYGDTLLSALLFDFDHFDFDTMTP